MTRTVHIGEAAKVAGASVDTIRFYQKIGLIKSAGRCAGGYGLLDGEDIHDLTFVRHAQELGFSLTEIKELLALRQKHHVCSEVQSMLKRKLGDVREKINSLSRLEAELARAFRNCNRELRLKREIKHEDCCPLLTKLDRRND
jgi:DNA-binding transcriptional MerR regulator